MYTSDDSPCSCLTELLGCVREIILNYDSKHAAEAHAFFLQLELFAVVKFTDNSMPEKYEEKITLIAQYLWTLDIRMPVVGKPFFKILKEELYDDYSHYSGALAKFARTLNRQCVLSRTAPRDTAPMTLYRGSELLDPHINFFKYHEEWFRVPGYFACSSDIKVARNFFSDDPNKSLLWIVLIPPRAMQGNSLLLSFYNDEREYLFPPYTGFKIIRFGRDPLRQSDTTLSAAYKIVVEVTYDNSELGEDVYSSPCH